MADETLLLSHQDVVRCLDMKEVIEIVEQVLRAHGEDRVVMPAKITLDLRPVGREFWSNAMPAYVAPLEAVGIKWVGGFANNPTRHGLPYLMATILLQDPDTGRLRAVMDGLHITNLRTGAAAAVSARHAARAGAGIVAIVGAGTQGRTSLWALGHLFQIQEVRVVDVLPGAAEGYAREMSARLGLRVRPCDTVQEAVEGADVVVTATTANEAVVRNGWLGPGVTAVALGSFQEFDDDFVLGADRIIVDSWEQCRHRGELARLAHAGKLSREDVDAELGDVVVGRKPGRGGDAERVLVVPIGLGSLDIAVASVVYQRARELGLGGRYSFV